MKQVDLAKNIMMWLARLLVFLFVITGFAAPAVNDNHWIKPGADGQNEIQFYFFWSLTCEHCEAAHPYIRAITRERPWVRLHALEVSRNKKNVELFKQLASEAGEKTAALPAFILCGEIIVGWDGPGGIGTELARRLDTCHARVNAQKAPFVVPKKYNHQVSAEHIQVPLFGVFDVSNLSLPVLTFVLAILDAFNPCAFFVLMFLLSMMTHQRSRARMALIGSIFVLVSGLMYFVFMAAWLNVFQIFGHLSWVTLAAGILAIFIGAVNIKDFFWFEKGLSLSIPESRKPEIFRRARVILAADGLVAMIAATIFLAIAANFYELLCTAGLPMVFTRLITLAELSTAGRYAYLAAYNLIYILPLAGVVVVFGRTLGARKLTEREGRLLKLMSGLMMFGLGALLLLAPELVSQGGIAFGLMAIAVGLTWGAARLTR